MFYAMYRMYSSMQNDLDKTIQVGNHVGVRIWVYLRYDCDHYNQGYDQMVASTKG